MSANHPEEVVLNLGHAPEMCFLTGSRAFNPSFVTPHTDYDFFANHTDEMCKWLEANDFAVLSVGNYADDPQLAVVYRHKLGIDVQLTKNVDKKLAIQGIIIKHLLFAGLAGRGAVSKIKQKAIWKALYEATEFRSVTITNESNLYKGILR